MMSRIGSVGSDAFTRSDRISNGVSTLMREHHLAMNPSRVDMFFGVPSPQSLSPASSVTLAFDSNEFDEEDVWGASEDGNGGVPQAVANLHADSKKYDVSFMGGGGEASEATDPLRLMSNGWRRGSGRDKDPGLSVAYADGGRARVFGSPLHRSAAASNGSFSGAANGTSSRTSSSRLIPRDTLYATSLPADRVVHQSAPVNVPDWSKILGSSSGERRPFKEADAEPDSDEDAGEERLPPHELVARDYARSQATTFSMCEGAGRTLKGRDQSRVRTAVLKRTGFYSDQ